MYKSIVSAFFIGMIAIFGPMEISAQGVKTVKGKVTSEGKALENVTVTLVGTTNSVVTDVNGKYELSNIPKTNQNLEFKASGYVTKNESLPKATTSKNVTLNKDNNPPPPPPPPPPTPKKDTTNDSLPIKRVEKSMRFDGGVDPSTVFSTDRTPLEYESLRADDAVFRQKLWREIDCREKINSPFMYKGEEDNGDQRFISILMQAVQDGSVTAFKFDRFTTPYTTSEVAERLAGPVVPNIKYDKNGLPFDTTYDRDKIDLDSFYMYQLKEEVIFDKESSKLFWRVTGIAPLGKIKKFRDDTTAKLEPLFWIYFDDIRPTLAKYDVYNAKNMSARMSWDDLFQSRMFSGRIIKTSMDNPKNRDIAEYPGLVDKSLLQLMEGESVKEKIFNYEQDQWSY